MLRFSLSAITTGLLFVATYWLFVLTTTGQTTENLGLSGAALRDAAARAPALDVLSQVSIASFVIAIVVVLGVAELRRRPGLGAVTAGVMVISVGLAEVLKVLLPRPELVDGPAWLLRNTFPSGHATVGAAIALGVLLVTPERLRWLAVAAGAFYAALIGYATQVVGWHRMSGALGGVLLVASVASIALLGLALRGYVRESHEGRVHPGVRGLLVGTGAVALVLSALLVALPMAFPILGAPVGAPGAFIHTALELLGFGLTILVIVGLGAAIEPYALGRAVGEPAGASAGSAAQH